MEEKKNPLGEDPILKLLIRFSVPAMVGMMVNALYNIVDRIFIGNSPDLGPNGLGGLTIAFPIMIIMMSLGVLFGIGGATLFSIRLGQKKPEESARALGNAAAMLMISGVSVLVIGQLFLPRLLQIFGASETILPYASEYMRIILLGAPFWITSMGLNNFIRADGNPRIAMVTMLLGAGVNVVLDPLFIYGFRMGMTGAALATVISQTLSFSWVLAYFLGKRCNIRLEKKNLRIHRSTATRIFSLGLPNFSLNLASSLLNTVLNHSLIFYGGDIAVSGMGVINSLQTLLFMPVIGLNQGVQPVISFNYGARKFHRVRRAVGMAIVGATLIVVTGFTVTRLFPIQLISLFNRDPELLDFGTKALSAWLLMFPVVGFQIIAANFFQAIGRYRSAMFLTLTRQIILLVPALLIFPRFWGMNGLLHAAPFADFFSFLLTGVWFLAGIRRLSAMAPPPEDPVRTIS